MCKRFKDYIKNDAIKYDRHNTYLCIRSFLLREQEYSIWKYIKFLRKEEYYEKKKLKLFSFLYCRKKNKLGEKLGIVINKNTVAQGLKIWHYGSIVVNNLAQIGENCTFHGNNCIGNDGKSEKAPVLGNNVDIGYGATIIGDIYIADNITIGAGSIVNKTFDEPGITIAGIPARKISKSNEQ